jgi:hypothetical protein
MLGYIEVQYLATTVFQYDKHKQNFHRDRGHGEEVHRNHLPRWLCNNVFQVWLGGRGSFRRMREAVRSEISIPSIFNSP